MNSTASVTIPHSRSEALRVGASHYLTDKFCKRGHVSLRHAKSRICLICAMEDAAAHRAKFPDRVKRRNVENYAKNAAQRKAHQREWNRANAEDAARKARQRRAERPEVARAWRQNNKGKVVAQTSKRRAAKLQRTPAWADLKAIEAFYATCPEDMEVDHIVPLRGRRVSGLHVLHNLQYLPKHENMLKGNRHESDQ